MAGSDFSAGLLPTFYSHLCIVADLPYYPTAPWTFYLVPLHTTRTMALPVVTYYHNYLYLPTPLTTPIDWFCLLQFGSGFRQLRSIPILLLSDYYLTPCLQPGTYTHAALLPGKGLTGTPGCCPELYYSVPLAWFHTSLPAIVPHCCGLAFWPFWILYRHILYLDCALTFPSPSHTLCNLVPCIALLLWFLLPYPVLDGCTTDSPMPPSGFIPATICQFLHSWTTAGNPFTYTSG